MIRLNIPDLDVFKQIVESKKLLMFFSTRFQDRKVVDKDGKETMLRDVVFVLEARDGDTILTNMIGLDGFNITDESGIKTSMDDINKKMSELKNEFRCDMKEGWYE